MDKQETKMKQRKILKWNRGITLIALVITIIVLLILAGVSIATLTGDNGILTKAQTAKTETEKASEEEQLKLAALNASMNTEQYDYETGEKDETGKPITVPIPAGFAPTQIEGENSIKDGVVITDKNENEFVFIPCYINEFEKKYNNAVKYQKWCEVHYSFNDCTDDLLPNGIESENMQITKYGGFYVARYITGREFLEITSSDTNDNPNIKINIQKGKQPLSYIGYNNAKILSEKFINTNEVQSGIITGTQWDTIMELVKREKGEDAVLVDSSLWGTYADTKFNIKGIYGIYKDSNIKWENGICNKDKNAAIFIGNGLNKNAKSYNIYDLAGNVREWTSEKYNNTEHIYRSGSSNLFGNEYQAAYRGDYSGGANKDVGFRIVLYLK